MKTLISLIRHGLTFLAGIGGTLLAWTLIEPGEVAAANDAGAALIEPLTVLAGLIAAGVARLALAWFGKFFPGQGDNGSSAAGGPLLLAGLCAATGLMGLGLSSCSSGEFPIRIGVTGPQGSASYSSQSGFEAEAIFPSSVSGGK